MHTVPSPRHPFYAALPPQVSTIRSFQPELRVSEKIECLLQTLKSKLIQDEELCGMALGCHLLDSTSKSTGKS